MVDSVAVMAKYTKENYFTPKKSKLTDEMNRHGQRRREGKGKCYSWEECCFFLVSISLCGDCTEDSCSIMMFLFHNFF